jgi:hypothetical protein
LGPRLPASHSIRGGIKSSIATQSVLRERVGATGGGVVGIFRHAGPWL